VRVVGLHRYPVKSMLGESLTAVPVTSRGLDGDRRFAVIDEAGAVGSAKHPAKWGRLLGLSAHTRDGIVHVTLPGDDPLPAGSCLLDERLSKLLGRVVTVSGTPPEHGLLERAVPEYAGGVPDSILERAVTDATGTTITAGRVAAGTFLDFGMVHLVTTAALRRLGNPDPARFRPNIVVDLPGAGFPEDEWVGRELSVGDVRFRVVVPTPRCVVPTLAHGKLPPDPEVMRTAAREHRVPVLTLGRLTCVGVYLEVLEPGWLRLGDPVTPAG